MNDFQRTIKHGDRVTIFVSNGLNWQTGKPSWTQRTGRAVMLSSNGGWVLNLGGPHGTPGIATVENTTNVRRAKR